MSSLPESYAAWKLPAIKLAHHPASSTAVTPIVVLLLDRPEAKNAFTGVMGQSVITALNTISRDPRIRAVVLTSTDPANKTFCAGADLDIGFRTQGDDHTTHRDSGGLVSMAVYGCNKPVIAAMNGSGVGIGITMTLGADIRIASNAAKYGFVFARRGLTMEACSSYFLPRLVGTSAATYLTTTGAALPAAHKMLAPLFAEIVAPDQVLPTALALAEDIAANTSVVSTRVMKDMLYRTSDSPEEAHLRESGIIFQRFRNRDLQEGIKSFKERRPPNFPGSLEEDCPIGYPWWDTQILERANKNLPKL